MDERNYNEIDPWDRDIYETGRTQPPKNRNGLVSFLLVVIILLGGMVSALSILNVRLFAQLQFQENENALMSVILETTEPTATCQLPRSGHGNLGITGEKVSTFYQRYYGLPEGLYITAVESGSAADLLGIEPGDILLSLGGTPVTDADSFTAILRSARVGDVLEGILYRGRKQYSFQFTITEESN